MPHARSTSRSSVVHASFVALVPVLAALLLAASSAPARADTFVIPHVLEKSGSISNTQNTFDTQFFMTYSAGLAGSSSGGGATVDLYFIDQSTGQPATALGGQDICNPCTYVLGDGVSAARRQVVTLENEIVDRGGFPTSLMLGSVIAVVSGDAGNVSIEENIVNAKTSAFDISVFGFDPEPLPGAAGSSIYVCPDILATSSSSQYTFDTDFFMTYSGGLAGIPDGGGATMDLYLLDASGAPLRSGTLSDVCNPCTFPMGTGASGTATPRKRTLTVRNLINDAGGFGGAAVATGFALLVPRGADPGALSFSSAVVNTKTSAFDLSVFVFEPQPIAAAATVAVESDVTGDLFALRARPNPAAGGSSFAFTLARASAASLEIFDAQGRRVVEVPLGTLEAGDHAARWDGRDAAGRAVAAGAYFGRLSAADGSRVTRLVMLSR